MHPRFIELHDLGESELFSVNVENICGFNKYIDPDGEETTAIGTTDGSLHVVSETYDEVKQMIKDSGIHIQKADPRLDTSHPLTMDDLQEMVGEPVWDSNNGRWYLIHWVDGDQLTAYLYSDEGVQVWRDDDTLKAKPMYRKERK